MKRLCLFLLFLSMLVCSFDLATAAKTKPHVIAGIDWRELTRRELANAKTWDTRALPPERFDYFNPNVKIMLVKQSKVYETCVRHGFDPGAGSPDWLTALQLPTG